MDGAVVWYEVGFGRAVVSIVDFVFTELGNGDHVETIFLVVEYGTTELGNGGHVETIFLVVEYGTLGLIGCFLVVLAVCLE